MKLNYFEYCSTEVRPTVYKEAENSAEVLRARGIEIDHKLLFPLLLDVHKFSLRIFFYMLDKLEVNDRPIIVRESELMREALPTISNKATAIRYIYSLIARGLIIKTGRNRYYINPVFVWTKGSERCFDVKHVPVMNREKVENPKRRGRPFKKAPEIEHN